MNVSGENLKIKGKKRKSTTSFIPLSCRDPGFVEKEENVRFLGRMRKKIETDEGRREIDEGSLLLFI